MVQPENIIVYDWVVLSVAFVLVGLRIAVRLRMRQRHLYVSDSLLLLACVFALGQIICDTITYDAGYMEDQASSDAFIGKLHFATNYFFDAGLYLPKLSMVAIYYHIIPLHLVWLRWALDFVAAFTILAFFVTIFADTLWCGVHVATNWDDGPDACTAFNSVQLMRINWSLCISCECMLFLLPLPLLAGLRSWSKRELAGLTVLLTLGVVTLCVSSGRFATMMHIGNDISLYIWAATELCVSIMVVACTALRPLLRKAWRRTRVSRSKSASLPESNPSAPHGGGTTSRRTERTRSNLADPFVDTYDDGADTYADDGDSASVVGLTRLPPARTRSAPDSGPFEPRGASELDLELGKPTEHQEHLLAQRPAWGRGSRSVL